MVSKLNYPVIFGISLFTEFNPQIEKHNHSVSLDLDSERHTIVATYAADLFSGIDLCTAD